MSCFSNGAFAYPSAMRTVFSPALRTYTLASNGFVSPNSSACSLPSSSFTDTTVFG